MKIVLTILRTLSRHTWWWTVALLVLLAVAMSAARLFLPFLERYKHNVEQQISLVIGQPTSVEAFEIGWHGDGMRLFLHNVRLLDPAGEQTLFGFNDAYIDVSLPLSLYRGQVALHNLTLRGIELELLRQQDGSISLAGMSLSQARSEPMDIADSEALAWLLRQKTLAIENSILHWRDLQQDDHALVITNVNLSLRNTDGDHFLLGQITLPSAMGGQVNVMAKAQGAIEDIESWAVDFYVKGTGLEMAQWLVDQPELGMVIVDGQTELELWGLLESGQLDTFKGRLSLSDVELAPDMTNTDKVQNVKIESLSGEFVWRQHDLNWTLDIGDFQLQIDDVAWEPARVHIERRTWQDRHEIHVASSFARLEDVARLLLLSSYLSDEQRDSLLTASPRGDLYKAYLNLQFEQDQLQDYFVQAQLEGLALLPWRRLPGFDGLDMSLNMSASAGVAALQVENGHMDTQGLFRDVLAIDEMDGQLAWQQQGDGLLLEFRQLALANQDAALQLDGEVFMPTSETLPLLKLLVNIRRGNGAATSKYLPVAKLPQKSVEWLDRAIVAGDITSGVMLLHGPVKHFPFNDASGRFEVRFNVANGVLDYKQAWPRIEQIEADVAFVNKQLQVNATAGKIMTSDITSVDIRIPDLRARPAQLDLRGEVQGATNDVLRFLNESPLQQRFGAFTEGAVAEGGSRVELELGIPLRAHAAVETHGRVYFTDSEFDLQRLGVDLSAVNGEVEFSRAGLAAKAVAATVMGQPAHIDIHTEQIAQDHVKTVFEAQGETRLTELDKRLGLFVFPHLEGESEWLARLEIPRGETAYAAPVLNISSNLQGTAISLPPPLQKSTHELREFGLSARFNKDNSQWQFDYAADALSGLFEVTHGAGLTLGELHFAGAAKWPQSGFRIAGKIDYFDYAQWQPLLTQDRRGKSRPRIVNQLDLTFDGVAWLGQTLHDVQLNAEYAKPYWTAQIQSEEVAGRIRWPDNRNRVLEMDLEHLYLARDKDKDGGEVTSDVDPADLPPLTIHSKKTRYGELELGQLELETRILPLGMSIESFKLKSPDIFDADIRGIWNKLQTHETSVKADLRIHDLGALLGGLGYVEAVQQGEGRGSFELGWSGPIYKYDLASMKGTVNFDFNDGSLLEVEPGAGRLFGLLSISALPRRLLLDFRDFFGKGFAFDYMRGHFDIRDGDAYTDNFTMDGPAAKMELQGRVGLVNEDYDQLVKVVPNVTGGLFTLAGILTGSIGPAVIVALIEKLTKSEVDKATGIYYQISGGWADPLVEPVDLVRTQNAVDQPAITATPLPE